MVAPALKGLATGAAVTGAVGFVGSGGQLSGIPAGMLGAVGGGASGGFSGGVLGSMLGAGLMAAAFIHPGTRAWASRQFGRVLGSETVLQGSVRMATSNLAKRFPAIQNVKNYPMMFHELAVQKGGAHTPQSIAAAFTMGLLKRKELMLRGVGVGAAVGAVGGMLVGGPMGTVRSAYSAGRNQAR